MHTCEAFVKIEGNYKKHVKLHFRFKIATKMYFYKLSTETCRNRAYFWRPNAKQDMNENDLATSAMVSSVRPQKRKKVRLLIFLVLSAFASYLPLIDLVHMPNT